MTDGDNSPRLVLTEPYFKVADLAKLLGVHRTTVYALIDQGELDAVSFGPRGGSKKVPESSVIAYLKRRGVGFAHVKPDHHADMANVS